MPTSAATASAVRAWSPVIIQTSLPAVRSCAMTAAASVLRVSATPSVPSTTPSRATHNSVLACARRSGSAASGAVSMPSSWSHVRLPQTTAAHATVPRTPRPSA